MSWETVIGLEVHVQLATRSKLFCGCATVFGDPPNTHVCPVCLGLPGALPVPNREAIRLGIRAALALGCTVQARSVFARKQYFYPDLPKGYQISQYDAPLAIGGAVHCESPERGPIAVGIERLHIEEDAGKSLHDRFPDHTAIDLNRAGVPLAEIVTDPALRSPGEARACLVSLKQVLEYLAVSDCSMEEGSLRVDANISIRRPGEPLGVKTEVKNLNSFAHVERALSVEQERQVGVLEGGGAVTQVTLLFDADQVVVRPLRAKEALHDYRYFPDPDLPPIVLDPAWVAGEREGLPELPAARRARFLKEYGLGEYEVGVLTSDRELADYFEAVVQSGAHPTEAAKWVQGEVLAGWKIARHFEVPPGALAGLIMMVEHGTVSLLAAKRIYGELRVNEGADPDALASQMGLVLEDDVEAVAAWVDQVLGAHPDEVSRLQRGEAKLLGFLVGEVIKASGGKANPKQIRPLLMHRTARDDQTECP